MSNTPWTRQSQWEDNDSVTCQFISSEYRKEGEVYSVDSAPLCSEDCTLLGSSLPEKWDKMKKFSR